MIRNHEIGMKKIDLQFDELKRNHVEVTLLSAEKQFNNKIKADALVGSGALTREEADRIVGSHRHRIHKSITDIIEKIWEAPNVKKKDHLPNNIAQIFYKAYASGEMFKDKPNNDLDEFKNAPQNVIWYHTDLVDIWKVAEAIKDDALNDKRRNVGFFAMLLPTTAAQAPRVCPSVEESCRRLGIKL